MGARTSAEMLKAQELLRQGLNGYQAAKQSGISEGAISKSARCQLIIAEVKAEKNDAQKWDNLQRGVK